MTSTVTTGTDNRRRPPQARGQEAGPRLRCPHGRDPGGLVRRPQRPGLVRWWDGERWTDATAPRDASAGIVAPGALPDPKAQRRAAKEQARATRDQARTQRGLMQAHASHLRTPVGRAESAFTRGDRFFQLEVRQADGQAPYLLAQVEHAGWRLEHASWVFVPTSTTSTEVGSVQKASVAGHVLGVYLFRRADAT